MLQNLHLILSYVVPVKSKVEISQNCVAFSEYMNFNSALVYLVPNTPILRAILTWSCFSDFVVIYRWKRSKKCSRKCRLIRR